MVKVGYRWAMTQKDDIPAGLRALVRNFGCLLYPVGLGLVVVLALYIKSLV
ncbi:hypothetical protein MMB232_02639 [Brevundimonas subvibrioides]|uniref:hypothetical protein n=1 Tax=Brevundimonas subvibrioides TaxID=74313 RepID=UPI0032D59565